MFHKPVCSTFSKMRVILTGTNPLRINSLIHTTIYQTFMTNIASTQVHGPRQFNWASTSSITTAMTLVALGVATYTILGKQETGIQCDTITPLSSQKPISERMELFVKQLQRDIVTRLEQIDGKKFANDRWVRDEGGEGISCVLMEGNVFEKAGVNVSVIHGELPPSAVKQMRSRGKIFPGIDVDATVPFFVAGISIVCHPHNPKVPTVHMNYRFFEIQHPDTNEIVTWWFGGGSDLTPSYLYEEDATWFHQQLKQACDSIDNSFYPRFKKWCDEYFYIPHRGECRGVGGLFFDDIDTASTGHTQEELFSFVRKAGEAFLKSYVPIVERRKDSSFTTDEKRWQQLRRGRYVEFNLVHDRGTKFGLATPGGRIESILMSLPLTARWEYMHVPVSGTEEAKMLKVLEQPRAWV